MQQLTCKMVWSFSFYSLYSLKKRLDFKRKPWGKKREKVWKSVKMRKSAENSFVL